MFAWHLGLKIEQHVCAEDSRARPGLHQLEHPHSGLPLSRCATACGVHSTQASGRTRCTQQHCQWSADMETDSRHDARRPFGMCAASLF